MRGLKGKMLFAAVKPFMGRPNTPETVEEIGAALEKAEEDYAALIADLTREFTPEELEKFLLGEFTPEDRHLM
ncbi:hypothetical protein [Allomesorhizobium camelthorni]|uniref:Uncharacterized protein n=1 Tax=Allomesorhizobium camelthorni TaxID=475069 RepID=A0A6G4W6M6_9HYPH|nr:hypothetical protein [Mesorhizobium camelthorni]NGO50405.1 hypothetical protein [Mesorhizobium camelthorni]